MRKILFNIFLALSATFTCIAQQKLEPLPMDPALRYGILDNKLTYYIRHNETEKDRADFYIVQNVGAILEEDSQNGLAHFLEHIHKAHAQRVILSYDHIIHFLIRRPCSDLFHLGGLIRNAHSICRNAAVAGRTVQLADLLAFLQLLNDGMLTSAATNHEYFHLFLL